MYTRNKGKLMNPKCFMHTATAQIYSFLANPCGNNCSGSVDTWVIDFKWGNPQRGLNWHVFLEQNSLLKDINCEFLRLYLTTRKMKVWGILETMREASVPAKSIRLWCVLEQSTMFQETFTGVLLRTHNCWDVSPTECHLSLQICLLLLRALEKNWGS